MSGTRRGFGCWRNSSAMCQGAVPQEKGWRPGTPRGVSGSFAPQPHSPCSLVRSLLCFGASCHLDCGSQVVWAKPRSFQPAVCFCFLLYISAPQCCARLLQAKGTRRATYGVARAEGNILRSARLHSNFGLDLQSCKTGKKTTLSRFYFNICPELRGFILSYLTSVWETGFE